jgi:hypothetical protein
MKNITKFSLIAATVATIGASAAFAGDSQLQDRLFWQRKAAEREQQKSVAVYSKQLGLGQSGTQGARPELRFEWRLNGKGQGYGAYVPVK